MGSTPHLTILHTADIHAQLSVHDEFFWEDGKPVLKRRGGLASWANPVVWGNSLIATDDGLPLGPMTVVWGNLAPRDW